MSDRLRWHSQSFQRQSADGRGGGIRGDAVVLRPQEVRARLAVSAATLRAWSTAYRDYLSPAAQVGPAAGHDHRRYTAADVQVLVRIGELVQQGHRREAIKRLLGPAPPSDPPAPHTCPEMAELAERLRDLEAALARAQSDIARLEAQAVQHAQQLDAEQTAHTETRRALADARRQLAEAQRANARLIEANQGLHAQVKQLERELSTPVWRRVLR